MSSPPEPVVTPIVSPIRPISPIIGPTIGPTVPPTIGPTTGGTASGGSTAAGSAPTISLTTLSPVYPANSGDQQAAKVVVAWDPSFANLPSLTFGLTVTDSLGATAQASVTVNIQQPPAATLTTPNNPVEAGSNITLDGSQSTGVGLTYKWQLTNPTASTTSGSTTSGSTTTSTG